MHAVAVGRYGVVFQVDDVFLLRHFPHPGVPAGVVPGVPVHFVAAERGARGHGQADPIRLHTALDALEGAFHIFRRHSVLRFEILMKNTQRLLGEAAVPVIQHQIQQQAAVLPAGEGDIDIVELLKNEFQPFQKGFVYVLL